LPKSCTSIVLATLLVAGLAGCSGNSPEPAPVPASPSAAPATPATSATSAPVSASPSATSTAASPSSAVFPLTISRQGGFAGVDDRVEIAANGSATVTAGGRPAVKVSLPAATVDELRRLVTTSAFTAPRPEVPTCNDGFEYKVATPSSTRTVHDCGQPHGEPIDRIVAIAAKLLNG
jgi:hypothetical protein